MTQERLIQLINTQAALRGSLAIERDPKRRLQLQGELLAAQEAMQLLKELLTGEA